MVKEMAESRMSMEKEKNMNEIWDVLAKRIIYFLMFFSIVLELSYFYLIVRPSDFMDGRDLVDYFQIVILVPFILQIFLGYIIGRLNKKRRRLRSFLMQALVVYIFLNLVIMHHDLVILNCILLIPICLAILQRGKLYIILTTVVEIITISVSNLQHAFNFSYTISERWLQTEELVILCVVMIFLTVLTCIFCDALKKDEILAAAAGKKYKKLFMGLPIGFAQAQICPNEALGGEDLYKLLDVNTQFMSYFGVTKGECKDTYLSRSDNELLKSMNAWFAVYNKSAVEEEILNVEIEVEQIGKVFNTIMYKNEADILNMVLTDITEEKETQEKLSKAIKDANAAYHTQSEFLANMSHEIRTPINGILGMLQLTLMADDLQDDYRDNLVTAQNCADTLLRLINDILDFTKLESGKYKIRIDDFDIYEVIENTVSVQVPIAADKGLTLDYNIVPNMPKTLKGDAQRIEQVLNCLLSNAIKFTATGGVRVKVAFIDEGPSNIILRMAVVDSGIGIAEENKDKLFKRFSQVDGSNTRKYGGSGLGLVITKQIVELMGGNISVQSKEDVGSTFIVEIPLEVVERSKEEETEKEQAVFAIQGKKRIRVLVAEDEPVNQLVIGKLLGLAGYSYDIAENGQVAVELFQKKKFDIALFDVQMPVMDGLEAVNIIRSYEKINDVPRTPIIAVTALAMFGDKERILEAQFDDYIAKPYSINDIAEMIDKYTGDKDETGNGL